MGGDDSCLGELNCRMAVVRMNVKLNRGEIKIP